MLDAHRRFRRHTVQPAAVDVSGDRFVIADDPYPFAVRAGRQRDALAKQLFEMLLRGYFRRSATQRLERCGQPGFLTIVPLLSVSAGLACEAEWADPIVHTVGRERQILAIEIRRRTRRRWCGLAVWVLWFVRRLSAPRRPGHGRRR